MLDSYFLLNSMNGVHEKQVIMAGEMLGYIEKKETIPFQRKLWSTLLIAAILVSLFTTVSYAMGWFGLRDRLIASTPEMEPAVTEDSSTVVTSPTPTVLPKCWVSLNGYKDSPEYLANAEWLNFRDEYQATHVITNDNSWMHGLNEETVNTCHFYGVYDQAMLDELQSLAEQYSLRLHTQQVTQFAMDDFYRVAGTGAFLTDGSGTGYIYEDGSFKLEYEGEQRNVLLTILKNLSGTILPLSSGMDKLEHYQEWEYTNAHGDTVLLAFNEKREDVAVDMADLRIFFDMDGVYIMAHAVFYEPESVSKKNCEQIADKIIFHELLKTAPDFSLGK